MNFGSICSGIEAASVGLSPLGMRPLWFSEIADFPSRLLKTHYPDVINLGDMETISSRVNDGLVECPDLLCGGTPCQAFSLAGWQKGLVDKRGQLTLSFIELANTLDKKRVEQKKPKTIILWENVEGVLKDRTNAFGLFISGLAGVKEEIKVKRWSNAGVLYGPQRNIAWRILDAKFFGLPQQRRRLFLVATDVHYCPEKILFEMTEHSSELFAYKNIYGRNKITKNKNSQLSFFNESLGVDTSCVKAIDGEKIEVFRSYTDCLYSAYGTKWNGNAAAYNGSLYVSQNDRVRRFTPLECERLMGFPDNYTLIPKNRDTNRYQAVGNSWPVPVITWIGKRIKMNLKTLNKEHWLKVLPESEKGKDYCLYLVKQDFIKINGNNYLNLSPCPNDYKKGNIFEIIQADAPEKFYISAKGSDGILRRKEEKGIRTNQRLEELFEVNSDRVVLV